MILLHTLNEVLSASAFSQKKGECTHRGIWLLSAFFMCICLWKVVLFSLLKCKMCFKGKGWSRMSLTGCTKARILKNRNSDWLVNKQLNKKLSPLSSSSLPVLILHSRERDACICLSWCSSRNPRRHLHISKIQAELSSGRERECAIILFHLQGLK